MLHIPQLDSTLELSDQTSILCEPGKQLVITAQEISPKPSRKPRPSWCAIGTGMATRHFTAFPYEQTLLKLTADEQAVMSMLLEQYDYQTGLSVLSPAGLTQSQKNRISRGYLKLRQRELVKRVSKSTYLINPLAKIHLNLFDSLYQMWQNTP